MSKSDQKFRYHGEQDLPSLKKWLAKVGANSCSLGGEGHFIQVGYTRYTVGGNLKSYSRIGGIITSTKDDVVPLCAKLAVHFSKEGRP